MVNRIGIEVDTADAEDRRIKFVADKSRVLLQRTRGRGTLHFLTGGRSARKKALIPRSLKRTRNYILYLP